MLHTLHLGQTLTVGQQFEINYPQPTCTPRSCKFPTYPPSSTWNAYRWGILHPHRSHCPRVQLHLLRICSQVQGQGSRQQKQLSKRGRRGKSSPRATQPLSPDSQDRQLTGARLKQNDITIKMTWEM